MITRRFIRGHGLLKGFLALAFTAAAWSLDAQDLHILDFTIDASGHPRVSFQTDPTQYYILYRGTEVTQISTPVNLALGVAGRSALVDPLIIGPTAAFYRLHAQPIAQPLDLDRDGIDDVYELRHPLVLNPLNPLDVADGFPGMVYIPAGTFVMGSPNSEPNRSSDETQHTVTLTRGFFMGQYEVTQTEYQAVMGTNPSYFNGGQNGSEANTAQYPVESISWVDSTNYCGKLTQREQAAGRLPGGFAYRLPTEAEWEYACRAGTSTPFHYGNKLVQGMANFNTIFEYDVAKGGVYQVSTNRQLKRTTSTGTYQPNPWGLYDLHGNVWEWCLDWYDLYPNGAETDPTGPNSGNLRVFRGGSEGDLGQNCRSAFRNRRDPAYRDKVVGIRVVLVSVP